jgi:hypothetical protein
MTSTKVEAGQRAIAETGFEMSNAWAAMTHQNLHVSALPRKSQLSIGTARSSRWSPPSPRAVLFGRAL